MAKTTELAAALTLQQPSRWAGFLETVGTLWRTLQRDKVAMVSLFFLIALCLSAVFAEQITPFDPTKQSVWTRLTQPTWVPEQGAFPHILGTDQLGRDILSRVIFGSRISIIVGTSTVFLAAIVGIGLGLISGFYSSKIDDLIMAFANVQMAFPGMLLALSVMTILGPSLENMIWVLALNNWMLYCRLARGMMLSLREVPFVDAARVVGGSDARIIWRHCFPNMLSPFITLSVLEVARMILAEASLSFLGFGVQPPTPAWGLMLADGRGYVTVAWWLVTFPGIMIGITVLAVNLVASWLRTVTDPYQRYKLLNQMV